jgi:multidrug efflux pump subunit AcrA (membrane-fusion protein)
MTGRCAGVIIRTIKTSLGPAPGSALVLLAIGLSGCGPKAPPAPAPPEVLVAEVKQQDVPIYNEYVGQLDASVNATIQSRVQGYLVSQNYKEGQLVKKDDVLFEIDRRPFEAALAQAKAAFLQADASAKQAEMNSQRAADLFRSKARRRHARRRKRNARRSNRRNSISITQRSTRRWMELPGSCAFRWAI